MLSCLLPPNISVMMMMSDRDFYILAQLARHPCSPSAVPIGRRIDICPSVTHLSFSPLTPCALTLPPPLLADTQARCHQCHSQPQSFSMSVFFPFFQQAAEAQHANVRSVKSTTTIFIYCIRLVNYDIFYIIPQ